MTGQKILVTVGILILFGFLFVIGLGDRGAVDLYQLKLERDSLHRTNLELQKKTQALYSETQRLKYDFDFVENIARTELGMIGKDEVVILQKRR